MNGDNVTPIRDPFDAVYSLRGPLGQAIDDTFCATDDYHPLPESDEMVLRAAMLIRQAIENLRAASELELARFRAWDELGAAADGAGAPRDLAERAAR